jgi:hypothetical protein
MRTGEKTNKYESLGTHKQKKNAFFNADEAIQIRIGRVREMEELNKLKTMATSNTEVINNIATRWRT